MRSPQNDHQPQTTYTMIQSTIRRVFLFAVSFAVVCATLSTQAQRAGNVNRNIGGGNFGGGGGGGFGGNRVGGGATGAGTRQYYNNGMVGEAMISSDPETRRLIVITDDETSQFVTQVVTNLDRPKPQVLIKVVFLEVTYGKSYDVGVEGGVKRNVANDHTTTALTNLFGLGAAGAGGIPGAGLYQLAGQNFEVTLRAIAQADKTEVLSRPSVLARNNQQAVITVGQEIPLITNTRFDTFGNQINTVQYQDVGIILRVTPFITSDGMVEMIISPEISNLSAKSIPISTGANPVFAPVIDKRAADTVVVTPDHQTVVIGGLMATQKTQTDAKIPLLGDIPILGYLFKRTQRGNIKTELMIFLTPHIVMQPSQLAGLSAEEREKLHLTPKGFTEQELNQYLNSLPKKNSSEAPKPANSTPGTGRGQL